MDCTCTGRGIRAMLARLGGVAHRPECPVALRARFADLPADPTVGRLVHPCSRGGVLPGRGVVQSRVGRGEYVIPAAELQPYARGGARP